MKTRENGVCTPSSHAAGSLSLYEVGKARARVWVGVLSGTESYSLFFFKAVHVHLLVALFVLRTKEACFPN